MEGFSPRDIFGFVRPGPDPLRNAGAWLSLLVLAAGAAYLAARLAAALRSHSPATSLLLPRMVAVLGALGGFVAYLRDQAGTGGRGGLLLGGLAAAPWVLAILLEGGRRLALRISRRRPRGPGRE